MRAGFSPSPSTPASTWRSVLLAISVLANFGFFVFLPLHLHVSAHHGRTRPPPPLALSAVAAAPVSHLSFELPEHPSNIRPSPSSVRADELTRHLQQTAAELQGRATRALQLLGDQHDYVEHDCKYLLDHCYSHLASLASLSLPIARAGDGASHRLHLAGSHTVQQAVYLGACAQLAAHLSSGQPAPPGHPASRPFNASDPALSAPAWRALVRLGDPVVVATAISSSFFAQTFNLIGSVQYWEPGIRVVVWDLGLSSAEVAELGRLCNVVVRRFPFDEYPEHVAQLQNYAWKPPIIRMMAEEFGVVFWLDSSMELRTPLTEIREHVYWDGYFTTTAFPNIFQYTRSGMFDWFGVPKYVAFEADLPARSTPPLPTMEHWDRAKAAESPIMLNPLLYRDESVMMISGNIQAWRVDTPLHAKVVKRVEECALDLNCIGGGSSEQSASSSIPLAYNSGHRYDQSAYSIAMMLAGISPFADHRFNEWRANSPDLSSNAFQESSDSLLTRRGGGASGPYYHYAVRCAG